MNNVCLIPARNKSKRIPNKNFKKFFGQPIIQYSIETAEKSKLFDKIYIAIDTNSAWAYFKPWSNIKLYIRDPKNSRDKSTLFDLVKEMHDNGTIAKCDTCCLLYPCAPFTTIEHLKAGLARLEKGDIDCVFPIVRQKQELYINNNMVTDEIQNEFNIAKHTGQFFFFDIKKIIESGTIIQEENGFIELWDYQTQDINTLEDWINAGIKWRLRQ